MYIIVWTYEVPETDQRHFEKAYDHSGCWAKLFARAEGYRGTELLRLEGGTGRYMTIDRWTSAEAFTAFRNSFAADYEALDKRFEGLTSAEVRLGAFHDVDSEAFSE